MHKTMIAVMLLAVLVRQADGAPLKNFGDSSTLTCTAAAGKSGDTTKALTCVFYVSRLGGSARAQYYSGTLSLFGKPLPAFGGRLVWRVSTPDVPNGGLAGPWRLDSAHPPVRNLVGGPGNAITLSPSGPSGVMAWAALATITLEFQSASP
jgi:hypothetical protein